MNSDRMATVIRAFLRYSFEDIAYRYEDLTEQERSLCTPSEFETLRKLAVGYPGYELQALVPGS